MNEYDYLLKQPEVYDGVSQNDARADIEAEYPAKARQSVFYL